MTDEEDQKALAQFSGRKGEAMRLVLSRKEDISRWMDEGWPVVAIFRLLRSKGIASVQYNSFRKAVKKIFSPTSTKKCNSSEGSISHSQDQQRITNNRLRPHERQRKEKETFVTISGVDHIGLDKKE